MKPSSLRRILRCTVPISAGLLVPSSALAQCEGSTIDTLDGLSLIAVDEAPAAACLVLAQRGGVDVVPRFDVFERSSLGGEFELSGSIQAPEWGAGWSTAQLDVEEDLVAYKFLSWTSGNLSVGFAERTPLGWETSEVDLPGNELFLYGRTIALSGQRVAALSGFSLNGPVRIQIIERSGGVGAFEIVDRIVLQGIQVPWIDYPLFLDLDGDIAAVSSESSGPNTGAVVVCERGSSGTWSETARLPAPSSIDLGGDGWSVQDLAVKGNEIAAVRTAVNGPSRTVLHVYRRALNGAWDVAERLPLDGLFQTNLFGEVFSVAFDAGQRVVISTRQEALVFSRDPLSGRLIHPHRVMGLGLAEGFTGSTLVGRDYRARLLEAPVGPGTTRVCSLAGLSTCAGSGASVLRVHEGVPWGPVRPVTAEVLGAQPGATVVLFRSDLPAISPALGGQLCIDRSMARAVGTPTQASVQGTAAFELQSAGAPFGEFGFGASDHLQAVVLGPVTELTNSVAWIP